MAKILLYKESSNSWRVLPSTQGLSGFTNAGFKVVASNLPDSTPTGYPSQSTINQYYKQPTSAPPSTQPKPPTEQQQQQQQQQQWSWNLTSSKFNSTTGQFTQKPTLIINGSTYTFNTPQEYLNKMNSSGLPSAEINKLQNLFSNQTNVIQKYNANPNWKDIEGLTNKYPNPTTGQEMVKYTTNPNSSDNNVFAFVNGKWQKMSSKDEAFQKIDAQLVSQGKAPYYEKYAQPSKASDSQINSLYQKYFGRNATSGEITNWKNETAPTLETYLNKQYKNASGIDYDGSSIKPGNQKTDNQLKTTTPTTPGNYSTEFENYWKNITPTFEKTEQAKQQMWEQWNTMGPPPGYVPISDEQLPTGDGPLPLTPGEEEYLTKKYTDAGLSEQEAAAKVAEITAGRKPTGDVTEDQQSQAKQYIFDTTNFSDLPDNIRNSDIWRNATAYDKLMLYSVFKTKGVQDPAIQTQMMEALGNAMTSLDPYYKMKTRIAVDEIERSVSSLTGDYESSLKSNKEKIKQLKEDLIFNKEQLTLDQQQEMTDQLRHYEKQFFDTRQQMAEAGLAFSSPRDKAEANLSAEQQGISQSTARKYEQAFRTQDLTERRQREVLQLQAMDLQRKKEEGITDISRKGEQYLGSTLMPALGVSKLGGIQGTLEADKQSQALQYGKTIQDYFKENI